MLVSLIYYNIMLHISPHHIDTVPCEDNFIGHQGHCYRYFSGRLTYNHLQERCENYGGFLAEIDNVQEQYFVEGIPFHRYINISVNVAF